jgi:hypothetical protein
MNIRVVLIDSSYCYNMNSQTIVSLCTITSIIIALATSFLITSTLQTPSDKYNYPNEIIPSTKQLIGKTKDAKNDAQLSSIYETAIKPAVQDYHDIISSEVYRIGNDRLLFTIQLEGNPNRNERFETVYVWLLSQIDRVSGKGKIHTIIIPNFANDSAFDNKGWHLAVFNNTNNQYSLPLSKLKDMPESGVEVSIDPSFLGNTFSFNFSTAVMVRVNDTLVAKAPDYLMDSAPDDNTFWLNWFK